MNRCALLLLLSTFFQASLSASDWHQWRGPRRDGTWNETGIISSFPSSGLRPRWRIPVGLGYSSPIVSEGMIYLSDVVVQKPLVHDRVSCFRESSGKRVWTFEEEETVPDWFFN